MMIKLFLSAKQGFTLVLLLLFAASCKSTKIVSDGQVNTKLSAKNIIKQHYQNELQFKTLSFK